MLPPNTVQSSWHIVLVDTDFQSFVLSNVLTSATYRSRWHPYMLLRMANFSSIIQHHKRLCWNTQTGMCRHSLSKQYQLYIEVKLNFFEFYGVMTLHRKTSPFDKWRYIFKLLSSKPSFCGVIVYLHSLAYPFRVDLFFIRGESFVYGDIYRMSHKWLSRSVTAPP